MSDQPEDLTLILLRRLDARMERMEHSLDDIKQRMTTVETQVGHLTATEQIHYAQTMQRFDRMEARLDRIERRLDLTDA